MSPTSDQIGLWVVIALTLIPAANVIVGWVRSRATQKREVSFSETYATTAQLAKVEADLSGRIDALDDGLAELKDSIVKNGETRRVAIENKVEGARTEARQSAEKLDGKIQNLSVEVGRLQNASESANQKMTLMDAKLDRLIERSNHL